ncbi:Carboxylic acid transporter [Neolecta irregularis DAH-3]|uniref:Carboxylic acid transporter n=1 Tax=Neolecta irregularis (strain DAH-3) TaxID=1198029 RepID=A0A1U7LI08_NEOID|nr:Carboxylic acid transporter [Neolecta irregularis DAH-3]|eukprot:OLL22287.1 Carboxylic acid transporter [Neolecta irregularis DAH-3]
MTIIDNMKGAFTADEGNYMDKQGNIVYGKLPREKMVNPFSLCRSLTWRQWVYFLVGYAAWTMDGYDFHSVSLSISNLAIYYGRPREEISTSITLTLMFRTLGAISFGIAGDMYGRKYPLIINLLFISVLQLATAYCTTFAAFLGVRTLFGIGMGGIWGLAASMSLENMPTESRGLFSGILQQGYALGYLIAALFNLTIVPKSPHSFKSLFFIGAGLTVLVALVRFMFPESEQYRRDKDLGKSGNHTKAFIEEAKIMLKTHWPRLAYACLLLTVMNCMSHGSMDMYPTFLQQTKGLSQEQASIATIIAKSGAIIGGSICSYYSQYWGRRAIIIGTCVIAACLIPFWVLPQTFTLLSIGGFLLFAMVQGAWGVVPIHLAELSPPAFRAVFPGLAYQIGNLFAAPIAQVISVASEHVHIVKDGVTRPDYGKVLAITMTFVFIAVAIVTAAGKEERGSHFHLSKRAGATTTAEGKIVDGSKSLESGVEK